jgi:OOP family OmpA-OmpF porin
VTALRRARFSVAGLLVAGGLVVGPSAALATPVDPAASRAPGQDEVDGRAREIEYRSRQLTYRSRALDNSERVEETPEETSISLAADVLFEYDRADLSADADARLDQLADQLSDLGPRQVTIGGHTDDHGEAAYNQGLSERRAESVRAALDARLDDEFTFEVAGYGEAQPVAPNQNRDGSDNPDGRALNRRVQVTFPS